MTDIETSTLNLFEAIMRGDEYMRQAKLSLEKAKEAVERARNIINNDPCVLSRKKNNIYELMHALHREKDKYHYFNPNKYDTEPYRFIEIDATPLHWVALLGSHYEMAKLFVEKYPTASYALTTKANAMPLHLACAAFDKIETENMRIVKLLLEVNPDAVCVEDWQGAYPLHYLCYANTSGDMIRLILEKFPEASKLRSNGWLPLQIAMLKGLSVDYNNIEAIKALMEYFPEAACVKDFGKYPAAYVKAYGNYPIHITYHYSYNEESDQKAYNIVKCVLEQSDFFGLFEAFGTLNRVDPDDDEYELYMDAEIVESLDGPPWKYVTPWSTICKKNGTDAALLILEGIQTHHSIIHDAIGNAPINDICLIIDSKNIDLISSVDLNRNKAISSAIHEASKDENKKYWKEYFNPLIEMLFRRECMQQGIAADTEIPASTILDRNGLHLLHLAAKEKLLWFGLNDILESYVDAARVEDVQSGLVPFMIAGEGSNSDLSGIFGVLRVLPDIFGSIE